LLESPHFLEKGGEHIFSACSEEYEWVTLSLEENSLIRGLVSFSLVAHQECLYLFGGKKDLMEASDNLYWLLALLVPPF